MTSQPGKHNFNTRIAQYLRIKGYQTRKFDQLLEYNTRHTFLEKSYTKLDEETTPKPFSKKLISQYLWINRLMFCTVCFYCMLC